MKSGWPDNGVTYTTARDLGTLAAATIRDYPQLYREYDGMREFTWGRTLARHGALRGLERDPNTPPRVRRLVRLARVGASVPDQPRYADAFEALGPAAIKFGQTLATRQPLG